ncbi:hypothetical protein IF1G_09773 [Cordyceps javanica]|uniref:Uncharacterized protein n=1 Tax=Cordyceps javanica TaxID=43265 RepID=A0A545UQH1_9HYPO|nr:hypothetical protein IF1G_09773 [Cordyceps javanica]
MQLHLLRHSSFEHTHATKSQFGNCGQQVNWRKNINTVSIKCLVSPQAAEPSSIIDLIIFPNHNFGLPPLLVKRYISEQQGIATFGSSDL